MSFGMETQCRLAIVGALNLEMFAEETLILDAVDNAIVVSVRCESNSSELLETFRWL